MHRPPALRAVLFDLDGTLADTAAELGAALNAVRRARGLEPLDLRRVRPHVSAGARGLLAVGLGLHPEAPDYGPARDALLAYYEAHLGSAARLFDGVDALLAQCRDVGIGMGIVTNKPLRYAAPLLDRLGVRPDRDCLITPDALRAAKPDPHGTLLACAKLGVAPAETLFVGDDARDIAAGKAAGTRTAVALWGYLAPFSRPVEWGADLLCPAPSALAAWLRRTAPAGVAA